MHLSKEVQEYDKVEAIKNLHKNCTITGTVNNTSPLPEYSKYNLYSSLLAHLLVSQVRCRSCFCLNLKNNVLQ